MENEIGLEVKWLPCDNGGEYELSEFNEFCVVNRIHIKKTKYHSENTLTKQHGWMYEYDSY